MRPLVPHLEHLLIQPRDRVARQYVSAALTVGVPGDGGAGLGLLRHAGIVTKRGASRRVQHQDGTSVSVRVRGGQKDQGLLPVGRMWVSALADVVVLCVLHALALATLAVLAAAAHNLDFVVRACVGHIQAAARTAGLRQWKDRLWVWTEEKG